MKVADAMATMGLSKYGYEVRDFGSIRLVGRGCCCRVYNMRLYMI
jgi:hypothetical protein